MPLSPKGEPPSKEKQTPTQNHFPQVQQSEPVKEPKKKQLILHQDESQEMANTTQGLKAVKEELEHDSSQLALINSQLNTYLIDENPT